MSVPVALPEPVSLTVRERLAGVAAVALAQALLAVTRRRPGKLAGVLQAVCHGGRPADPDRALRARRIVETVSPRCAGPHGCLPRSVSVLFLCRLRGERVTWHVGTYSPPPNMHAWVEASGRPVGEPFAPRTLYIPILTVGREGTSVDRS